MLSNSYYILNSTQEKILLTALHLFYNNGIRATGVNTIVRETGIAKMSLYKYYPAKNDLIIAYLLRQEKILMERYQTTSVKIDTPKAKLLAVFDLHSEAIKIGEFKGCPFINALSEFPNADDPIHRTVLEILNRLWLLIVNLTEQIELSQSNSIALQLSLLFHGSIVSEPSHHYPKQNTVAKEMAEFILEKY